jgi:Flp pilus assembly protein TadD
MSSIATSRPPSAAFWITLLLLGCGGPPPPQEPDPPPFDDPAPAASQGGGDAVAPSSDLVRRGMDSIQKQDFAGATSVLRQAAQQDPKDAQAAYYLGVALEGSGDAAGAMTQYRKALELDPKLAEPAVNLSGMLFEQRDAAGALSAAEGGLKHNPKSPELLVNRALALEALGKKPEALSAYGAAVEARPGDPELRLTYAELLTEAGKSEQALAELRAIQGLEDPVLIAALAVRFGRLKAFGDCIASLDRALKTKPSADLHTRRGVCRHGSKDDAGAQADYQAALALDPGFAPAHYYLGKHLAPKDRKKALEHLEQAAKLDASGPVGKQARSEADELKRKK